MSEVLDLALVIIAVGGAGLWTLRRLTRAGAGRGHPSGCASCATSGQSLTPPARRGARQLALPPHVAATLRRPPYLHPVPRSDAAADPAAARSHAQDPPARS